MLSEKEKQFIAYWEQEREKQSTVRGKIMNGLPMAVLFSLPIILLLFGVYFFLPEWYTKISNTSAGSFIATVIAVFLCIIFLAYFRMQYKWETNEQIYRELKAREFKN